MSERRPPPSGPDPGIRDERSYDRDYFVLAVAAGVIVLLVLAAVVAVVTA